MKLPLHFKAGTPLGVSLNLFYRVMKITPLLILLLTFSVNAKSLAQRVSLNLKNASLKEVIGELRKQTDYYYIFNNDAAKATKPISANFTNIELDAALNQLLKNQPLSYEIDNGTILITKNVKKITQQQSVKGSVRDAEGEPLTGATIKVKGTSQAVVADLEGNFELTNISGNAVLEVSFTGFFMQEIALNGRSEINIVLNPDVQSLNEVVVVGYGTQKRVNLTGSVSTVSASDLETRPITNLGKGLQGLMPGVTVRSENTAPGSQAPNIRIRGIGTWGDATPLVVIDGIPGGDMNILNPDDIESVSVLKDAASSSIYGVRGANGVILVTTKKGTAGAKPAISVNSYFGFQTPTALPHFLGSPDYMELQNEASVNANQSPTYTAEQIEIARNGSDPNYFANTDWIEEVYKKSAPQQSHNISVNGGSENLNYYASYGYLKEGGLVVGDNFNADRHNVRLRLNTTVLDRLQLDGNLGYIDREVVGSASGTGALSAATSIRPLVPVHFTNGSWGYHGGQSNPVAVATDGGSNDFGSQEITANINANLNIIEGLDVKAQYGVVKFNSKRTTFLKTIDYFSPDDNSLIYQTNFPNNITLTDYTGLYQTFIGTLNYNKTFNEKHEVTGLLGASLEETITEQFNASRQSLPTQDVPSIALGTENQENGGKGTQNALQSLFGRLNYVFDGKYLFEGNFRYDGSSRFAPEVRWHWFGSASVGWVFTEEEAFEGIKDIFQFGKIRLSYGTQGNDRVGQDFPYQTTLGSVQQTSNNPIGDEGRVGFRQTFIPNRLLTWETAEKMNLGLDLQLLNNRLTFTGDYFINKTKDILLYPPLPDVIGVGTGYPPQNSGEVENKGWEIALGWQDKVGELRYGVNFNLSDVKNRVTHLENFAQNLGDRVRLEGYPLDAFYGFIADRIAQINDFDLVDGKYVAKFPYQNGDLVGPGDLIYHPSSPDDTEITVGKDRYILGSDIPRYTYGFRGDVAWKGIDLSFFIQGVGKADGLLTGSARHPFINNSAMPQDVHLDRWTPENTDATYPRFVYMRTHNTRVSSWWIEDASYLRLKNVQLGYTLPKIISSKVRAEKIRIYASGENLFTKTDFFYGYDPETPVGSGAGYYPQMKTFTFGISVNLR